MCLKFDVWLGHLHPPCSSKPDAFASADGVINAGVSVCPKVSASASTLAGRSATGWGRDQSRTPSTHGGSSDISPRDVLTWKLAIQTRKKSNRSRISRPQLDEEVETACWTLSRSKKPSYLSRSASRFTRGPDDALLLCSSILQHCYFFSEGGKEDGFAGSLTSRLMGHSQPIRAESGEFLANPVRTTVSSLLAVKVGWLCKRIST